MKVRSMQRVLDSLEAQLREQQVLASSSQDEASQYKSTATQMRYKCLLTLIYPCGNLLQDFMVSGICSFMCSMPSIYQRISYKIL